MSETKVEIAVGGVVLAVALGFLVYASQIAGLSTGSASYPVTASFRSIEGVNIGTDVRLAGVKIGTVSSLELNPQTYRADTTMSITRGVEIPDDSAILISSEGLLGGTFVEIQPGGSPFYIEEGGEIEDTQSAVSLITLLLRFVSGGDE